MVMSSVVPVTVRFGRSWVNMWVLVDVTKVPTPPAVDVMNVVAAIAVKY
jgi:hypothetical protein